MDTVRQALAMLEAERVMTLVPVAGTRFRSLVGEIVGGPVKGSWWGHPKGKLIYRIASELEASGAVLTTKLVQGKVTFVHRVLWPALLRVVTDVAWRREASGGLDGAARELLAEAEARGKVQLAGKGDEGAKKALEARHLVVVGSEHTDRGAHAATVQSWASWAVAAGAAAAGGSLAAAHATLAEAGLALDGVADRPG